MKAPYLFDLVHGLVVANLTFLLVATNVNASSNIKDGAYGINSDINNKDLISHDISAVGRRKLSKKNKATSKEVALYKGRGSIEGTYHYYGSCNNIYKAIIECGVFGGPNNIDSDLCIYKEFSVGAILTEEVPDAIALDNDLFYEPKLGTYYKEGNERIEKEANDVDPNEVCVLSGTFRHSSTVVDKGSKVLAIPLAKSNACNTPKQSCCLREGDEQNFQFVVKANILDNGDLNIDFSSDYGMKYYTDDFRMSGRLPEDAVEVFYVAKKSLQEEGSRQLQVAVTLYIVSVSVVWVVFVGVLGYLICSAIF